MPHKGYTGFTGTHGYNGTQGYTGYHEAIKEIAKTELVFHTKQEDNITDNTVNLEEYSSNSLKVGSSLFFFIKILVMIERFFNRRNL